MTTAALLVDRCRSLNIRLWAKDGRLRFDAPLGALDAELRAALVESKAAVLALLDAPHGGGPPATLPLSRGRTPDDPDLIIDRPDRDAMRAALLAAALTPDAYAVAERLAIQGEGHGCTANS